MLEVPNLLPQHPAAKQKAALLHKFPDAIFLVLIANDVSLSPYCNPLPVIYIWLALEMFLFVFQVSSFSSCCAF